MKSSLKASETVSASARRVICIAVEKTVRVTHKSDVIDVDETVSAAYDTAIERFGHLFRTSHPVYCKSPLSPDEEREAANEHVGVLVNNINEKAEKHFENVVALQYYIELRKQLRACSQTLKVDTNRLLAEVTA